jgi:hypothetical protein
MDTGGGMYKYGHQRFLCYQLLGLKLQDFIMIQRLELLNNLKKSSLDYYRMPNIFVINLQEE